MLKSFEKIFFTPGDVVTIKHNIPNKPQMLVKGKETAMIRDRGDVDPKDSHFKGIKCFWFTTEGLYQEQTFSTKDLQHIEV